MVKFNKVLLSLAVTLVIVVGALVMSGSNARGGTSGGTEEYKIVGYEMGSAEQEKILNEYAKQGWKLRAVNANSGALYLAR